MKRIIFVIGIFLSTIFGSYLQAQNVERYIVGRSKSVRSTEFYGTEFFDSIPVKYDTTLIPPRFRGRDPKFNVKVAVVYKGDTVLYEIKPIKLSFYCALTINATNNPVTKVVPNDYAPNDYIQDVKGLSAPFIGELATNEINMSYNKAYSGTYTAKQHLEATELLYKEINYYRERNGIDPVIISEPIVDYACRWGNYMVEQHHSPTDRFYEHSKYGPESFHIPSSCSEIIHLIYFDHYPSACEIVNALMWGIVRTPQSVIGWTLSEGHNRALLQEIVKYYGASIYVFKTTGNLWAVYGTVNFSITK